MLTTLTGFIPYITMTDKIIKGKQNIKYTYSYY